MLEDASVSAGHQLLRGNLDAELARQTRLQAEATSSPRLSFPKELADRARDETVRQLMAQENALFQTRRDALREQSGLLESQIDDINQESQALKSQQAAAREAEDSAAEELRLYESLREQQFVSTARLLAQQRLVAEYQARQAQNKAELARADQHAKQLRLQIIALRNEYAREAAEGLKESGVRVNELRERMLPSEDALRRQTITAPVSGKVLSLHVHTPGSSIGPREPLLDIVPEDEILVIEAQTAVDSIKQLHVGQTVDIRFTALPYRTTPLVTGKVSYISPDVLIDQKSGIPAYQVHVQPDPASLKVAHIARLEPGMAAELYIQTESRTTLEYLLRPITDTVARSFRER